MNINWEKPPQVKGAPRGSKYDPLIDTLVANPGDWAKVFEGPDKKSAHSRRVNLYNVARRRGANLSFAVQPTADGYGVWAKAV